MRVLALTVSMFGGDWPPVVAVGMGLYQRGHEVSVIGDAVIIEAIKESGLVGIEWPEHLLPRRFFEDAGPNSIRPSRRGRRVPRTMVQRLLAASHKTAARLAA